MPGLEPHFAAAGVVRDAGGELVGRTRLQKIVFLTQLAGFGKEFSFEYRHYGPYSEDLAQAMEIAVILGPVQEKECIADWGGRYSVYTYIDYVSVLDSDRAHFIQTAKTINAIELEILATAAYIFTEEGIGRNADGNPWLETKRRKPNKTAEGRLEKAYSAYEKLSAVKSLNPLPKLPPI